MNESFDKKTLTQWDVVKFYCITIIITWLFWLPAFLIESNYLKLAVPTELFLRLGCFVPTFVGLIMALKMGGKSELKAMLKSFFHLDVPVIWILFLFSVLPGISIISTIILILFGGNAVKLQFPLWFIPIAFIYILIFMGPFGEEAGWRGFALKRMLRYFTPLQSAVQIGLVWSLWHLPLFFIKGTIQYDLLRHGMVPALAGYTLYTVMISLLISLFYIKSNASILGSILFHAVGNLSIGVAPIIFSKLGAVILLLVLGASTVLFMYRFKNVMLYHSKIDDATKP